MNTSFLPGVLIWFLKPITPLSWRIKMKRVLTIILVWNKIYKEPINSLPTLKYSTRTFPWMTFYRCSNAAQVSMLQRAFPLSVPLDRTLWRTQLNRIATCIARSAKHRFGTETNETVPYTLGELKTKSLEKMSRILNHIAAARILGIRGQVCWEYTLYASKIKFQDGTFLRLDSLKRF